MTGAVLSTLLCCHFSRRLGRPRGALIEISSPTFPIKATALVFSDGETRRRCRWMFWGSVCFMHTVELKPELATGFERPWASFLRRLSKFSRTPNQEGEIHYEWHNRKSPSLKTHCFGGAVAKQKTARRFSPPSARRWKSHLLQSVLRCAHGSSTSPQSEGPTAHLLLMLLWCLLKSIFQYADLHLCFMDCQSDFTLHRIVLKPIRI